MAITTSRGLSLATKKLVKYLDGEYSLDGTQVASVLYAVTAAGLISSFPNVGPTGDSHPLFGSSWKAFRYRWRHHDRVSKELVFLQVDFLSLNVASVQEEEADSVVGEEPITSHPEFLTAVGGGPGIAGTFPLGVTVDPATGYFAGTPRDGAIFDRFGQNKVQTAVDYNPDVGKFLYFAPGFQLGGVSATGLERYFVPRGTYARSYSDTVKPSLANVGKAMSTAPTGAPTLATGFIWLFMRIGYRKLGFIYRITEGYQAGRWNPVIYPAV
ncbi:MAG: hypothetical protein K0R17_1020 [Rariglobus sp.]|jgi:hypothetical protein|nr:hypothetical protein [Rariglobus sp.]